MGRAAIFKGRLLVALLALGVSATFAVGALAAAAQPTPLAPSAVYANNQVQPTRLPIKPHGHYSHTTLHNLVWANWGQATATARGTFTFQFCFQESCSVSPFYDQPALVTLSGIARCRARLTYTTLTLDVEATLPDSSFTKYRSNVSACAKPRPRAHRKHH